MGGAASIYVGDIASSYERERAADPMWQLEHDTVAPALRAGLRSGDRVLDVAAGTGRWLEVYAAAGARPVLLDVSADMLAIAGRHAASLACPAEIIQDNVFELAALPAADWLISTRFFNWIPLRRIDALLRLAAAARIPRFAFTVRMLDEDAPSPRQLDSVERWRQKNLDVARGTRRKGYYHLHPRPRLLQVLEERGLRVGDERVIERARGDVYSLFLAEVGTDRTRCPMARSPIPDDFPSNACR